MPAATRPMGDWVEDACLPGREHHRRIARVLDSLDAELLLAKRCLFGGGAAIALRHGEHRELVAIDFIASNPEGPGVMLPRVNHCMALPRSLRRPARRLTVERTRPA